MVDDDHVPIGMLAMSQTDLDVQGAEAQVLELVAVLKNWPIRDYSQILHICFVG